MPFWGSGKGKGKGKGKGELRKQMSGSQSSLDSRDSASSQMSQASASSLTSTGSGISRSSNSSRLSMLVRDTPDRAPPRSVLGREPAEQTRRWVDTMNKTVLNAMSTLDKKRQQVIYELIYTEEDYVADLQVIRRLFRQGVSESGCLSADEVSALFANLDEVIAVNTELRDRLLNCRGPGGLVEKVGHVFVDMLEGQKFDAYLQFCTNQNPASDLYRRLRKTNPDFDSVMHACESNIAEAKGFDLPAFLLKGMQRLLKYQPLLSQVRKYTMESETAQVAELKLALKLFNAVASQVNAAVRTSENARRLAELSEKLSKEVVSSWLGKPQVSLDLADNPSRQLIMEGTLKYVRQAKFGDREQKTEDLTVILVSDKLLLCQKKDDDRLVIRDRKDLNPVILLHTITDVRGEKAPGTDHRTILSVEIGAPERPYTPQLVPGRTPRDSPRPQMRLPGRRLLKFEAGSQSMAKNWAVALIKAVDAAKRRMDELASNPPDEAVPGLDEYAVTLLISTKVALPEDSDVAIHDERTPDWEIEFTQEDETTFVETTRHVRLVQSPEGLGFTLVGRNPVVVQEVEQDGVAFAAGMMQGDVVRAVNGQECTNASHDEVVGLLRHALGKPQPRVWVPTHQPLEDIREADTLSATSQMLDRGYV